MEFQNRGDRFTASDGARVGARLDQLEAHQKEHENAAREGYARIRALELKKEAQDARCQDLRERIAVLENRINGRAKTYSRPDQ